MSADQQDRASWLLTQISRQVALQGCSCYQKKSTRPCAAIFLQTRVCSMAGVAPILVSVHVSQEPLGCSKTHWAGLKLFQLFLGVKGSTGYKAGLARFAQVLLLTDTSLLAPESCDWLCSTAVNSCTTHYLERIHMQA